jgi:hypothetical protein
MSNVKSGTTGPRFKKAPLITGAALMGAGALLSLAGLAVGGTHLVSVIGRWIDEMETPPSEQARQKWLAAKAAMAAGAAAWQEGQPQPGQQPVPMQASRAG